MHQATRADLPEALASTGLVELGLLKLRLVALLRWLKCIVTTQKLALVILLILPFIQSGLIGAEIGLPLIFNDPEVRSAKGLFALLSDGHGVVVAGAFFTLVGGLIALQAMTSRDTWPEFVQQSRGLAAAVWVCVSMVLIGIEIAALSAYTGSGDQPLWSGLAVGVASGTLMSAGLTWSTWRIGPSLGLKTATWWIPGLTVTMTLLVDWFTNASAILMLLGLLIGLRFCIDRLTFTGRLLWLLSAVTFAGITNSGYPFGVALIGSAGLALAAVWKYVHWKAAAGITAALFLVARANVFHPVVAVPLVQRDPVMARDHAAALEALPSAARRIDAQSAAVCDPSSIAGTGAAVRRPGEPMARAVAPLDRLSPAVALENWSSAIGSANRAPPTVIVIAASGGGYRATFWTAVLIDEIRRRALSGDPRFATFARDARYLTGASGGMVALAYFAAMTKGGAWNASPIVEKIRSDVHASAYLPAERRPMSINSLQPVLQSLLTQDIPTFFGATAVLKQLRALAQLPPKPDHDADRGVALDRQWQTLARPFSAAEADERKGISPVLILAPAISETGEPLIISNFDLNDDHAAACALPAQLKARFPAAFADMTLSRAVRGNASFPRVSPIMAITEDRVQHVTDAGFVDNYGLDMIARLFGGADVYQWMKARNARLVILEIRAYPNLRDTDGTSLGATSTTPTWQSILSSALFHMTSTVQTVLNARTAGNTARAEQQIKLLKLAYAPASVETFVFESKTSVSMSWLLQAHELEDLRQEARRSGGNVERELNRLADHLASGHTAERSSQTVD